VRPSSSPEHLFPLPARARACCPSSSTSDKQKISCFLSPQARVSSLPNEAAKNVLAPHADSAASPLPPANSAAVHNKSQLALRRARPFEVREGPAKVARSVPLLRRVRFSHSLRDVDSRRSLDRRSQREGPPSGIVFQSPGTPPKTSPPPLALLIGCLLTALPPRLNGPLN